MSLCSGTASACQQACGAQLLGKHPLLVAPSVVSAHSWNLLIDIDSATGMYALLTSKDFELDSRLHPPAKP